MFIPFKYKIILSFFIIELFFLSFIIIYNYSAVNRFTADIIDKQTKSNIELLKESVKVPLMVYDLATLDNIIEHFGKLPNVDKIILQDINKKIISKFEITTSNEKINLNYYKYVDFVIKDDTVLLGYGSIEFNLNQIYDQINKETKNVIIIAIIEIIFSLITSFLIGRNLSKNLTAIDEGFKKVSSNQEDIILINIDSNDEFKNIANSFYNMQIKIKEEEKAKSKAEESTKLKSEFLANMSHEIRTPMNGIIGMTHLVQKTSLNKKQKDYIEKIDNSAFALLSIINDILDFSKIEAGKLNIDKINFDLSEIIDDSINLLKIKSNEKGLKLEVGYDSLLGNYFYGDNLRIKQILINLVSNAIKFTSIGSVKIYIKKISDKIVRFEITDTGIGLTKEQQDKLFQSFTQADGSTTRKYGGTGLGLAISKQLVELMNGKIWCVSKINIGSSFIFEIELPSVLKKDVESKIEITDISKIKNSNILLVEDNTINQEVILGLLEDSGINIDIANNGQEAIDIYKQNTNKFDLILMDIQMPIMDGYEATRQIREFDKDIVIIALSADAMKKDIEKSKTVGMQEHLNKPIDVDKLYQTLLYYISIKNIETRPDLLINEIINTKNINQKFKDTSEDKNRLLPDFKYIDKEPALYLALDNEELLLVMIKGLYKYKDIKLEILEDEEFKRVIHTIKGVSASAGATNLYKVIKELDETQNKELIPKFYEELKKVCDEIDDKLNLSETNEKN
jgi:signal transduction histidine kinase/DNA-binding NarL/FixJ family response regulator/HPt (histidine-containing phosphotransfer) domain-containing protein